METVGLLRLPRSFRSLRDVGLLLHVLLLAAAVPIVLRVKLSRLWFLQAPVSGRADPEHIQKIVQFVELVLRLGKPFVCQSCLTRGLTRLYFLRRAGVDVTLCFGVGYPQGSFAGHCWLVRDGRPYLESTDPRQWFTEMYRLPCASPSMGAVSLSESLTHSDRRGRLASFEEGDERLSVPWAETEDSGG